MTSKSSRNSETITSGFLGSAGDDTGAGGDAGTYAGSTRRFMSFSERRKYMNRKYSNPCGPVF